MDWGDLVYLLAAARSRSLSGAARTLGVSTSTVARRLDALERNLELRLLDRSAGGLRPTTHGRSLLTLAERVEDGVGRLERSAAALRHGAWPDPIRVTATDFVVSDVLAPALPMLWAREPGLQIHLVAAGAVVSLARRQADVAIRMARPVGDSLVARRLPPVRLSLYASRQYLAGRDARAMDLGRERLIGYDDSYGRIPELEWIESVAGARALGLRTGSTRALLRATVAGAGIAILPMSFAAAEPDLVEIPPPRPIPVRSPWIVFHRDLRRVPAVRAVCEWIRGAFAATAAPRVHARGSAQR